MTWDSFPQLQNTLMDRLSLNICCKYAMPNSIASLDMDMMIVQCYNSSKHVIPTGWYGSREFKLDDDQTSFFNSLSNEERSIMWKNHFDTGKCLLCSIDERRAQSFEETNQILLRLFNGPAMSTSPVTGFSTSRSSIASSARKPVREKKIAAPALPEEKLPLSSVPLQTKLPITDGIESSNGFQLVEWIKMIWRILFGWISS
jgi:hypothetical protein